MEPDSPLPYSQYVPPPVTILGNMKPLHTAAPPIPKIHYNIILQSTPKTSKYYLPFRLLQLKFYMHLSPPSCVLHDPPISSFIWSS
jgi:hypothetical protein